MEYCGNRSIGEYLRVQAQEGVEVDTLELVGPGIVFECHAKTKALRKICEIAEAIAYLHSEEDGKKPVLHGDIRPVSLDICLETSSL
jgi:serine/threonine protein kinase